MEHRYPGWLFGVLAIGVVLAVGAFAYNVGMAHGLAQSGALAAAGGAGAPGVAWGWGPRPWGGFGFVFPLFFILFWFVILRGLFWGGRWHGRRGWYRDYDGVPPAFEEWHRRAHAQPGAPPDTRA